MTELAAGQDAASERRPRKHHWATRRRSPRMHKSESNTPLEQATLHLFPWPADAYPGRLRGMVDLIGKAARDTIVDWRRGRYSTPQWARDRIATELEKRAAAFLATATELRK